MPAIRDYSYAYESVTTDSGLTIPMCSYEAGDLLFAIAVCDIAVTTWGCSNGIGTWNLLVDVDNTAALAIYWKYAAASGEGDVVFTASSNDTYSGCVVAVRDVYQSYTGGSPPLQANATSTGTRPTLPTLTTNADNSLVLAVISSTAAAPSLFFTESVLHDLVKVDGTAEGVGVGWFFKKTAGLTTAYTAGALVSGAGSKVVIECRAPAGGATVIPAYVASESSILITPQPGIAWDSNTAIAATADTNFGTSIAGKTCNDGTVATAVTDIGIDAGAFMSMAGVTNAASANTMGGAEAVVASARYNVGTRNILGHFRHAAPSSNQRLSPISSGRGVWFGMKSGTTALTDWKVWQVHGKDAPSPPGNTRPFIVNVGNTDTIATAGTLSNSDVRRYGFWTGGVGVLTQQAAFGPIWAMDTTVVSGGIAAEPVDIQGIVTAAALSKVRYSSQLQGANQMLCLQALQFGDGGTNPIYLKINGGAIEFPTRKDTAQKLVNYNGLDDSIGWTFYPGASDTIDLAGTAFAASSKYHWRIHASASASATYDFSGVVVNGAGDVQLRAVTTITGMTFTNCPTIVQNSSVLSACAFTNSTISTCNLPSAISGCTFTKTSGTSHALVITVPGTYSFSANQFVGYAASNGSTGNEAIYNNSGGSVTLNIAGGGSTPSYRNGTSATTTIVSGATVTFTGLPTGTDIVILTAGTSTVLTQVDQHPQTSYAYAYSGTPTVDVGFIKPGYVPFYIRGLSLSTSDASIPVALTADRTYV